jgi:hypothetical protein
MHAPPALDLPTPVFQRTTHVDAIASSRGSAAAKPRPDSSKYQYGYLAMREHLLRFASQQQALHAFSSVRCHRNPIASLVEQAAAAAALEKWRAHTA